jgi:hypothetical protein
MQDIVKKVAHYHKITDYESAKQLGYKKIQRRINYFCVIAYDPNKQFTANDLKDHWYFNSTMKYKPLLYALTVVGDVKKIKTIIDSGVVINNRVRNSLFALINELEFEPKTIDEIRDLYTITQLLIDNKDKRDTLL